MADKWAQFVVNPASQQPPPAADKWAQFAVNPNPQQPEQPGNLERAGTAFKEWTPPAPASDWPEFGPQFRQQLVDLYHQVAGIVPATNRALTNTGNAMLRGDALDTVRQAPGIVPVVGPMTQQIGQDVTEGKYPEAVGHTLNLGAQVFGPRAIAGAPRAVEAVTDAAKTAAPVVAGAAKGAVKAIPGAIETSVLKYSGVPQLARGAINGAKAALTERLNRLVEAQKAEETAKRSEAPLREPAWRNNPDPSAPGAPSFSSAQPPMGMDLEGNLRPAELPSGRRVGPAPATPEPPPRPARVSLADQYGSTASPTVVPEFSSLPAELPSGRRVGPAPPVEQAPPPPARTPLWQGLTQPSQTAAPEFSSSPGSLPSGRVPGQPRTAGTTPQETIAQIQEIAARPEPAAAPPAEATAPAPAETTPQYSTRAQDLARQLHEEMQRSGTASTVEPEAAPFDYAAQARADRAANSKTLAEALSKGGIPLSDASLMDPSHWKMLAEGIGAKVPNAKGIAETLANLQQMEEPVKPNPLQAAVQKNQAVVAKSKAKLNGNRAVQ